MFTSRHFGLSAYGFAIVLLGVSIFGGRAAFGADEPHVMDTWVRMPVISSRPAGGYMVVHGSAKADTLVSVTSPKAERIEMHSMAQENGVMKMRAEKSFAVPAKGELKFAPGGSHLMIFGLSKDVKVGDMIPLTFGFKSGTKVTVQAEARPSVAAAQPAGGHKHH